MATVSEIISAMREAAPPGRQSLDHAVLGELRSLTQALIAARPDVDEECARFLLLDATLKAAPREALARVAALTAPFEAELSPAYQRILAAVRRQAEAP